MKQKKNVVKLTEGDLKNIVKQVINEISMQPIGLKSPSHVNDSLIYLKKILDDAEKNNIGIKSLCKKVGGMNLTTDEDGGYFDVNIGSQTFTVHMKPHYIIDNSFDQWDDENGTLDGQGKLY